MPKAPKSPPFLPEELVNFGDKCPACGSYVQPKIWHRFDEPLGPIYPVGTSGEKGMWQRQSISTTCECGETVHVDIDPKKLKYAIYFYGDESARPPNKGWSIECYSMIGGTSGPIRELQNRLDEIKREFLPAIEPANWRIHATHLLSGQKRLQHPIYKQFDPQSSLEILRRCAALLKDMESYTWNCSIFGFRKAENKKNEKKASKLAQETYHVALLSSAIYRATKQELRPRFYLDAQKPVKKLPHIEGWSRDSFLGSRHYLAHEVLTHGNEIKPPEFLHPGSHQCLELADVHAYFLARNLDRAQRKLEPEIQISEFGKFYYMAVIDGGRCDYFVNDSIPTKYIPSS